MLVSEIMRLEARRDSELELLPSLVALSEDAMESSQKTMEVFGDDVGRKMIYYILKDHVWLRDDNSMMRFICKEFWAYLFGKSIDRLQANNKGVFLLYDHNFKWLVRSCPEDSADYLEGAERYNTLIFSFVQGLIKGGMQGTGFEKEIEVEVAIEEENVKFTINIT